METLGEMVDGAVLGADRIALEDERESLTGAQLRALTEKICASLASMGVGRGDRVLFAAPNSARWVAALLGALKLGAVVCPVHPENGPARLNHYLEDSGAVCVVADRARIAKFEVGNPDIAFFSLDTLKPTAPGRMRRDQCRRAFSDLAAILYTSGSTGTPMGIMIGHRQALFAVEAIKGVLRIGEGDAILCGLPFSFDYGLYQIFLALLSGARLVVRAGFPMPMTIPKDLRDGEITVFPAVPSLLSALLRSSLLERITLPRLRLVTSTGDVLPANHASRLGELLPGAHIVKMYGLTECKRVSIMPPGMGRGREGSVGLPLPGTTVWLEGKKGVPALPGKIGELIVQGPHVMQGYWNNPKATEKRFSRGPDGERVLRTGDLFLRDEEGFLYFVGRKGRMIKTLGNAVSPAQVEDALCSVDGVNEAAVLGLPDADRGNVLCAVVAVDRRSELMEAEVIAHCAGIFPSHCVPRRVWLLHGQLPKNQNGKVHRKMIRFLFEKSV